MAVKDAISRIAGLLAGKSKSEEMPDIDDDKTTDRYLKSLRRERRLMNEREEKKRLKKEIEEDNKEQNAKMFLTDDDNDITKVGYNKGENYHYLSKVQELKGILRDKKIDILKRKIGEQKKMIGEQSSFFTDKKVRKKPFKKNNPKQLTWLGKSNI